MATKPVYRTIVLMLDGSEASKRAAAHAISLASNQGARLVAVAVVDTETLRQLLGFHILVDSEMRDFETDLETSARNQLSNVVDTAVKAKVDVVDVLIKGSQHSSILSEAKAHNADLVVLPTFQATRAQRDLAAREKQLIVDEAPCPVLLVD